MSEFCQYTVRGSRCVLRAHGLKYAHELQPPTSAAVSIINRQEAIERRLSDPVEEVLTALDRATSAPAPGSTASTIETTTSVGPVAAPASGSSTKS